MPEEIKILLDKYIDKNMNKDDLKDVINDE